MTTYAVTTPVINGTLYSFASIEMDIDGLIFADVTAIDYADAVKPGLIFGTGGVLIGRTPGLSKPTLSITLTRRCWDALREQLAKDTGTFSTKSITVRVTHFEKKLSGDDAIPDQLVTDVIQQVRVVGPSAKNAVGNAASLVVLDCSVWRIQWGGEGQGGEGITALADDETGIQVQENDPVTGENVAASGSATWWSKTDAGFEAAGDGVHALNAYDTFKAHGIQFPGLCKVTPSRPPARAIEEQKPNGSDATAMIDRGYIQAIIDVDVTLWMRAHLALWEGVIRELWSTPGKASRFEEPEPAPTPKLGTPPIEQQKAAVARANKPILREVKAIEAGRLSVKQRAMEIYYPALSLMGVTTAIMESISPLVPGPEPQTFVSKVKLRQYVAADNTVARKAKGTAPPAKSVGVTKPLQDDGKRAKNSPSVTPGSTQGKP